jgi:hypothetical protein
VNGNELFPALGSNNNWDSYFVFAIDNTANVVTRVGYVADYGDMTPSAGFYLRYDTATDTNWELCVCTGSSETCQDTAVSPNTSFHKVRIRSTTIGTILITLDGGTEYSFCAAACDVTATIDTGNFMPAFSVGTLTTAARNIDSDFWAFEATGVSR